MQFKKFLSDTDGSIASIAAIGMTCLLTVTAASIEFAALSKSKQDLQMAADAAVLAVAISGETNQNSRERIAQDVAQANYEGSFELELNSEDPNIEVSLKAEHQTIIMGMFGRNFMPVSAIAGSEAGLSGKINIVLALDTTQSMNGNRLIALQNVATNFISEVNTIDDGRGNAKIGLVPFADYVRLPQSFGSEPWLDVPPDRVSTWQDVDWDASTNCRYTFVAERRVTRCDNYVYEERTSNVRWNGCMGSRPDGRHDTPDYGGFPFKGIAGSGSCTGNYNFVRPLTTDFEQLVDDVENYKVYGQTYMPAGIIWGWRALQQEAIFTDETIDPNEEVSKVLVLMTDGSNTTSMRGNAAGWDGLYNWGVIENDEAQDREIADNLTLEMCTSIKSEGIRIITVAFEVDDNDTKETLKSCASEDSDFYDAIDAERLEQSFASIGSGLSQIRLKY